MPRIPLPYESSTEAAQDNSASELINCYPVLAPDDARAKFYIESCAGLKDGYSVGPAAIRGVEELGTDMYIVSGGTVYRIDEDDNQVTWGTIPGSAPVAMAAGFFNIMVTNEFGDIYAITDSGVQQVLNAPAKAKHVEFWTGVFVFTEDNDSGRIFRSKITPDDGEVISFDPLQFQTLESDSDAAVGTLRWGDTLVGFGTKTTEFYNFGTGDPFVRLLGRTLNVGCASRFSITKAAKQIFWLANDGVIYRNNGERISTLTVERLISLNSSLSNVVGYDFKEYGRHFVAFNFDNVTWCYDIYQGTWHKRRTYGLPNWQPRVSIFARGKQYMGDTIEGRLMELDPDTEDYMGTPRIVVIQTPYVHAEERMFRVNELKIFAGGGVGTLEVTEPKMMISYSKDGGRTFSSEQIRVLPKRGVGRRPMKVTRIGRTRDIIFRLAVSDAVSVQVIELKAKTTLGRDR